MRYNRFTYNLWDLNTYTTLDETLVAIRNIPYNGRGTMTGQALKFVQDEMLTTAAGAREGVTKVILVVTDGKIKCSLQYNYLTKYFPSKCSYIHK